MPTAVRPRRQPTDDWQQLRLLVTSPEQASYELLRPLVLFGQPVRSRARETGVPERTLRRKITRFAAAGMRMVYLSWPCPPNKQRGPSARPRRAHRWAFLNRPNRQIV